MSASSRATPLEQTAATSSFVRRRPLPALGLPRGREDRRASAALSLLLHVLIVMLMVTPFAVHHAIVEREQGAGGPGPAGGGGGGHGGTGGADQREHIQFIRVAPQTVTPAPTPPAIVPPPPTPVPPPQPVKVEPALTPPPIEPKVAEVPAAKLPDVAAIPGTGGGTGHDGTNGTGPGSGGGVGTGIGTGRGSGVGPGTGGGTQGNYPPTLLEMLLPPLPTPEKLRGSKIVAEFDVDSTGRVLGYDFTPTKDGAYNKRLSEILRGYRFRAGTTPQGQPLRMKTQISLFLP